MTEGGSAGPGAPEPDEAPRQPIDLPFRRSMPLPLLALFAAVAAGALGLVVWLLVRPPQARIALAERRSPPRGAYSHDVGSVILAPIPSPLPATGVPCPDLAGVVIEGGPPAQARLGGVLERLCRLSSGPPDVAASVRALARARIRFARFARTGEETTTDLAASRVLVNVGLARRDRPASEIGPLLVHEGYHLAHSSERFTATQEYLARAAELDACRLLLDVRSWPRGCADAQSLVQLGEGRAVEELVGVGYPE